MKTFILLIVALLLSGCAVPKNPSLSFGKKCHVEGENITYSYVWLYNKESGLEADKETCEKHVCDWIERYEAIYGSTPNIGSAYGYMYADIAAKAIEIAGNDLNTDSFIDALESIKDYQLIFGDGILSFGPEKHLGSNDAYLFEVQNGKFVQISDQDISASEQELLIQ